MNNAFSRSELDDVSQKDVLLHDRKCVFSHLHFVTVSRPPRCLAAVHTKACRTAKDRTGTEFVKIGNHYMFFDKSERACNGPLTLVVEPQSDEPVVRLAISLMKLLLFPAHYLYFPMHCST